MSIFETTRPGADAFDPDRPDDHRAVADLDLDPGECRRVDDNPEGRFYHLRVGDLYLTIDANGVRRTSPAGMHYAEAYGRTESVHPGEAFAFLHGDYSPDVTNYCLACGATFDADETQSCGCPVGTETAAIEWPDVPVRAPRGVVDGQLVTMPM